MPSISIAKRVVHCTLLLLETTCQSVPLMNYILHYFPIYAGATGQICFHGRAVLSQFPLASAWGVYGKNSSELKLYVPTCTGLTGDGVVKIVQLLHEHKGNIIRLRFNGISRMSKHHLDIIMSLINSQVQQDRSPLLYNHRVREVLNTNDERPIDVDVCPLCTNVRLVFDCTRDDCREVKDSSSQCRGCYFCVTRCEKCGGCISSEDLAEVGLACSDFTCLDCWLTLPKCSTCNRPYCERHANLMVPLSTPGQFSCQRCTELSASLESQEDGY